MSAIAEIYASLIEKGRRTIDQVPDTIKEEVEEIIAKNAETNK